MQHSFTPPVTPTQTHSPTLTTSSGSIYSLRLQAQDPQSDQRSFEEQQQQLVGLLEEGQELLKALEAATNEYVIVESSDEEMQEIARQLEVLTLNVRLGHAPAPLPASTMNFLLKTRIGQINTYLQKLQKRVKDPQSKILVTGDVNAGKSTLVNSLLRRAVCPVDQQQRTTAFSEILDSSSNNGVEEAHLIKNAEYNINDPNTYEKLHLGQMEAIVTNEEYEGALVKVFTNTHSANIVHNGIADLVLIDGPGLNTDTVKTLAAFTRQEEIDVVLFVVNAENHFTLSAREFLQAATQDKAHIFVVVNKYDNVRDKERCNRLILTQLKEMCPATWENASDLVHFISAQQVAASNYTKIPRDFARMEQCLRWFALEKRTANKLWPARRFLGRVALDVEKLARWQRALATKNVHKVQGQLERVLVDWQSAVEIQAGTKKKAEAVVETCIAIIEEESRAKLCQALQTLEEASQEAERKGWSVWRVGLVRSTMNTHWLLQAVACQDTAREYVSRAVEELQGLVPATMSPDLLRMYSQPPTHLSSVALGPWDFIGIRDLAVASGIVGCVELLGQLSALKLSALKLQGKTLVIFMVTAGLWLLLKDLGTSLHRRIECKLRDTIINNHLLEYQVDYILRGAAAALRFSLSETLRSSHEALAVIADEKSTLEQRQTDALVARRCFKQLCNQAHRVAQNLIV